jgi:hypothetical protein
MVLPMSVCLSATFYLETRQPPWFEVISGAHCCNNVNRGHCWKTLLQQCEPRSLLEHIVTTQTGDTVDSPCCNNDLESHYCRNDLYTIVAFDTVAAFVIPIVALLTSTPVTWSEGHLWNFSILQRVHLSKLVTSSVIYCYAEVGGTF